MKSNRRHDCRREEFKLSKFVSSVTSFATLGYACILSTHLKCNIGYSQVNQEQEHFTTEADMLRQMKQNHIDLSTTRVHGMYAVQL